MKKLITIIVFAAVATSCAPKQHIGYKTVTRDGVTAVTGQKKFISLDKCQKKSRRMAKRRARYRDHNPNYGISTMGGARQRR